MAQQISQSTSSKSDPEHSRALHETIPPELQNLILLQQVAQQHQHQQLLSAQQEKAKSSAQLAESTPLQSQQPQCSSENRSSTTPNDNSPKAENCPKGMKDAILYAVTYVNSKISSKMPYVLTLNDHLEDEQHDTPNVPYRNRMRNITSDTFVCLNRLRPTFLLYKDSKVSMYSNSWPQVERLILEFDNL